MRPRIGFLAGWAIAAILLPQAGSSHAVPGGEIGTLPTGHYHCDLPSDVTKLSRHRAPEGDFRVIGGSNYSTEEGRGSYLLTAKRMVMTGGPFKGRKFNRTSYGLLRELAPDGSESEMRCVLVEER